MNYNASLIEALTQHGVPQELAEKVSSIIASDEPGKPNMGRSPEDQKAVNEALRIFWDNQNADDSLGD